MATEKQSRWLSDLLELEWWTRDEVVRALASQGVGPERAERLIEDAIASSKLTVAYPPGVLHDFDPLSDKPADYDYQRFQRDQVIQWFESRLPRAVDGVTPKEEPSYPAGPSGPHQHLAAWIEEKMRAHSMTAGVLSGKSRLDPKTIKRLRDGQPVKREDVRQRLADVFGVNVRTIPEN